MSVTILIDFFTPIEDEEENEVKKYNEKKSKKLKTIFSCNFNRFHCHLSKICH